MVILCASLQMPSRIASMKVISDSFYTKGYAWRLIKNINSGYVSDELLAWLKLGSMIFITIFNGVKSEKI